MDHRLAAVHADAGGEGRDHVVGDGQDDQLDLLNEGLRLGERAHPVHELPEPLPASASRLATAWIGQPARRQGGAERGADGARPDDARVRRLAGLGVVMGMHVVVDVDLVAMPVVPVRHRVQVDAGLVDRCSVSLRRRAAASAGRSPHAFIGRPSVWRGTLARIECNERTEIDALSQMDPFGARAPLGPGLPDLYRVSAAGRRDRRWGAAGDGPDPAREPAPPRRRRHRRPRPTSRPSPRGARASRRGRDPVHARRA